MSIRPYADSGFLSCSVASYMAETASSNRLLTVPQGCTRLLWNCQSHAGKDSMIPMPQTSVWGDGTSTIGGLEHQEARKLYGNTLIS